MKAISFRNIILGLSFVLLLLVIGCASSRTYVTEEKKSIPLHHVKNTTDELDLTKGDAIAMACTKCRTVVSKAKSGLSRRFFRPLETRHYCPGCKSTITVTGLGLKSNQEIKHTCVGCGNDSVFRFATKRASAATQGMATKQDNP